MTYGKAVMETDCGSFKNAQLFKGISPKLYHRKLPFALQLGAPYKGFQKLR